MRWRLNNLAGTLVGVPLTTVLGAGGILPMPPVETDAEQAKGALQGWLAEQFATLNDSGQPAWLVLPEQERSRQPQWQGRAPEKVELAFGRSGATLAFGQAARLQTSSVILAVDSLPGSAPGKMVTSQLKLELVPDASGLMIHSGRVDGRPGRPTDLSDMLREAAKAAPVPGVVMMPGTGNSTELDRLMGSLSALEHWADRGVRWEFAEARIGPMGVVGSLFNRYWLQEGYRLGDWQGQAVIVDVDSSPLAGLSVVDYNA